MELKSSRLTCTFFAVAEADALPFLPRLGIQLATPDFSEEARNTNLPEAGLAVLFFFPLPLYFILTHQHSL